MKTNELCSYHHGPRGPGLRLLIQTILLVTLPGLSLAADRPGTDLLALMKEGETVEAASRHSQSLTDAPAHVTVITRQDIDEFGYETIGEAISSVVGFYLRGDLNYNNIGVRGFAPLGDYGSHVLIMIDGHPVIEPVFASTFFDRNQPFDMRYVQRIEVVRGPGSALYGTNAVLAVINVITTKATDSGVATLGASVRSDEGGDAFGSLSLVGTQGYQLKVSGAVTRDEGFDYYFKEFDDPATNFGKAHDLDAERTWSVHSQAKWYGWSLAGLVSRRTKQIPTASWASAFNDARLKTRDILAFLESKYETPLGRATRLSARLGFDWYSYKGVWPTDDGSTMTVMEDPHSSRVLGGEVVLSSEKVMRNYLVGGFSARRVLSARLQGYQTQPEYLSYVDLEKTDDVVSAFGQDEISVYPGVLTAIVGARWDHDRSFGGVVSPRLGVILKSRIGATKLLYGRSFRAPTLYELYYDDTNGACADGASQANPDLRAEKAYTYEAMHETDIGKLAHVTVSAFHYKISGLINEVQGDGDCLTSVNAGAFRSRGIEVELRGGLPGGLRWSLDYDLTDSRNEVTGERVPISPSNLGDARLVIPLLKPGATLGLSARFLGERLTKNGEELEPVLVADATLYIKRVVRGLSLSLSAKNLFNVEHLESAGPEHLQETLPQDKRVFMIRATWEI